MMIQTAANTPSVTTPEEVSQEEIAAVEAVLRTLESQQKNKRFVGFTAQWFLVMKMFKSLEVSFSRSKTRDHFQAKHRAILTSLMGMGDLILAESEGINDAIFELMGISRSLLGVNVRYLRDKYEQWYVLFTI